MLRKSYNIPVSDGTLYGLHSKLEDSEDTYDNVIRRLLERDASSTAPAPITPRHIPTINTTKKIVRRRPSTGPYRYTIFQNEHVAPTLKQLHREILLTFHRRDHLFLEKLSQYTKRERHIVAKSYIDLHGSKMSPEDKKKYSDNLIHDWKVNTCHSKVDVKNWVKAECEIAEVSRIKDVILHF